MKELNKNWRIKNKRGAALQRGDRRRIPYATLTSYVYIRILCILCIQKCTHKKHTINARIQMRVHTCHVHTRMRKIANVHVR